jgi:hypothetical protein
MSTAVQMIAGSAVAVAEPMLQQLPIGSLTDVAQRIAAITIEVRAKLSMKLETEKMKRLDFMAFPLSARATDGAEISSHILLNSYGN